MKKLLCVFLSVLLLIPCFFSTAAASVDVKLICEGQNTDGKIVFALMVYGAEGLTAGDIMLRAPGDKLIFSSVKSGGGVLRGNSMTALDSIENGYSGRISFYYPKKITAESGCNTSSFSALRLLFIPKTDLSGSVTINLDGSFLTINGVKQSFGGSFSFNLSEITNIQDENESTSSDVPGDVDLNGYVTSADARLALRASVGLQSLSAKQKNAADIDNNGYVTSADARLILRKSVGLSG